MKLHSNDVMQFNPNATATAAGSLSPAARFGFLKLIYIIRQHQKYKTPPGLARADDTVAGAGARGAGALPPPLPVWTPRSCHTTTSTSPTGRRYRPTRWSVRRPITQRRMRKPPSPPPAAQPGTRPSWWSEDRRCQKLVRDGQAAARAWTTL